MGIDSSESAKTNSIKIRRMYMESVWEKTASKPRFDALSGNKKIDVLIIGGGIAGILCAYKLKNACVDCMLVESDEICGGITKNTTAKITLGHLISAIMYYRPYHSK